jgi:hypothetical protein
MRRLSLAFDVGLVTNYYKNLENGRYVCLSRATLSITPDPSLVSAKSYRVVANSFHTLSFSSGLVRLFIAMENTRLAVVTAVWQIIDHLLAILPTGTLFGATVAMRLPQYPYLDVV